MTKPSRAEPEVRIQLPPSASLLRARTENPGPRAAVLEVRIHLPPALSPLRTSLSGGKRGIKRRPREGDRVFESFPLQRRVISQQCWMPGKRYAAPAERSAI